MPYVCSWDGHVSSSLRAVIRHRARVREAAGESRYRAPRQIRFGFLSDTTFTVLNWKLITLSLSLAGNYHTNLLENSEVLQREDTNKKASKMSFICSFCFVTFYGGANQVKNRKVNSRVTQIICLKYRAGDLWPWKWVIMSKISSLFTFATFFVQFFKC